MQGKNAGTFAASHLLSRGYVILIQVYLQFENLIIVHQMQPFLIFV